MVDSFHPVEFAFPFFFWCFTFDFTNTSDNRKKKKVAWGPVTVLQRLCIYSSDFRLWQTEAEWKMFECCWRWMENIVVYSSVSHSASDKAPHFLFPWNQEKLSSPYCVASVASCTIWGTICCYMLLPDCKKHKGGKN